MQVFVLKAFAIPVPCAIAAQVLDQPRHGAPSVFRGSSGTQTDARKGKINSARARANPATAPTKL